VLFDARAVQRVFHAHGPLILARRSGERLVHVRIAIDTSSYIVTKNRFVFYRVVVSIASIARVRLRALATSSDQPASRLFHMRRMLENNRWSFTKKPAFERLVGFGATPRESVRRLFRLRHLPEAAAPSQSSS